MSRIYNYTSGLSSQIQSFIDEKRALGCKYEKEAKVFYEMDRFLVRQGVTSPSLSQEIVEKWIEKRPNEKRKNQRWRLNFTKRFVSYLLVIADTGNRENRSIHLCHDLVNVVFNLVDL